MAEVGVRELKARLSHYLKRARSGEQIIVTDRGKPVAVIGPMSANGGEGLTGQTILTPEEAVLWKLVAEGKVRWSGGKPRGSDRPVRLLGGPSMAQTIIEGRE